MNTQSRKMSNGFTIVELLIVIVVIAILAAIAIVAYSGIQQQAIDSSKQANIDAFLKSSELYKVENGTYPEVLVEGASPSTVTHQGNEVYACPNNAQEIIDALKIPEDIIQNPASSANFPTSMIVIEGSSDKYACVVPNDPGEYRWVSEDAFEDEMNDAYDEYVITHPEGEDWTDQQWMDYELAFVAAYPAFNCVLVNNPTPQNYWDEDQCSEFIYSDDVAYKLIPEEELYFVRPLYPNQCSGDRTGIRVEYWSAPKNAWQEKRVGAGRDTPLPC